MGEQAEFVEGVHGSRQPGPTEVARVLRWQSVKTQGKPFAGIRQITGMKDGLVAGQ
jgi:hypothetical protein